MTRRNTHTLTAADGTPIACTQYHTDGADAVLIICPGFFQSKDTPTFQRMSEVLAETMDVLAMDFRGHGRSGGVYTFSATEQQDLEAVLAFARQHYSRIGVLGFSMGAAITMNTAARHPTWVQSVIAVSGPCVFEAIEFKWWTPEGMRTGLAGMEPGAGCRPGNLLLKKQRPLESVRRIGAPILFVHGTNDPIVGFQHSRRLCDAAAEPKRLEVFEGGGHAEALFREAPERFTALIRGWCAQTLTVTGGPSGAATGKVC